MECMNLLPRIKMVKKEYKARVGARFNNNEAQVIGNTIEKLRDNEGHVTTQEVLDSARSKKSPINKYFNWNDTEAAEQYRLHQARELISHVVEIVVVAGEKTEQRSFFSTSIPDKGMVYVTLKDAIGVPDYRRQLLDRALITLKNLHETLTMFREHDYK